MTFCRMSLALAVQTKGFGWLLCKAMYSSIAAVNLAQEPQPLDVAVVVLGLSDDLAIEHVEGGKQCGGAVAVDPVNHEVYFPLKNSGHRPVLRVMRPVFQ